MKTKFVSPDARGALGILIPAIPGVFDIALAPSRRHGAGRHGTSRETRTSRTPSVWTTTASPRKRGCDTQDYNAALTLLRTWDGPDAHITSRGIHFWPHGQNHSSEFSETAFDRPVQLVHAMNHDGL